MQQLLIVVGRKFFFPTETERQRDREKMGEKKPAKIDEFHT
jgi:hypothetical protein